MTVIYIVAEVKGDFEINVLLGQHQGSPWPGVKRIRAYLKPGPARSYRTILRKQGREVEAFGVVLPTPGTRGQIWKMES